MGVLGRGRGSFGACVLGWLWPAGFREVEFTRSMSVPAQPIPTRGEGESDEASGNGVGVGRWEVYSVTPGRCLGEWSHTS